MSVNKAIADIIDESQRLRDERDMWKANHDNMVYLNRLLRDRPDLAERARLVDELVSHRDASRAFSQLMDKENRALAAERDTMAAALKDAETALLYLVTSNLTDDSRTMGEAALSRFWDWISKRGSAK